MKNILVMSVAVLALGASESWATTSCPTGQTCTQIGNDCFVYLTDDPVNTGKKIATIIGTGNMWDAEYKSGNSGWNYYYGDTKSPFYANSSISSVQFAADSNITSIGNSAFGGASSLTSITIPDGVTSIGDYAFINAYRLTSITIPEGVTSIGYEAFAYASGLTSITIPDSVNSIGNYAFLATSSLTEINCLNTKNQCDALRTLLNLSGRTFNSITPVANCGSYNSSGCTGCKSGYDLSGGECVAKPAQNPVVNPDSGDSVSEFNPQDCYNQGQVPWKGECRNEYPFSKKHWTPAEANKWLYDDNNTITITFKHQ